MRRITFREGVVATAMMWLYEKQIAAAELRRHGGGHLERRDLTDQFIIGSLVYNSGIVHAADTHAHMRNFDTGALLYARSERNAARRPRLDLLAPRPLLAEVLVAGYREQPTSWLAVYHVMQRYGAWEALRRFTNVFDATGAFVAARPPQK